jgi:hypothetical protein
MMENALAEEFSLLFYIGLSRENNHETSDYPFTTGFMRANPKLMYPKDFLMDIIRSDQDIPRMFEEWIKEAAGYQELALSKLNKFVNEKKKC